MNSNPSTPVIQLDGTPINFGENFPNHDEDNQTFPAPTSLTVDNEGNVNLGKQLRMSQIKHENGQMFFPAKDISRILSKEKIASELEQHQLSKDISVDEICEMYLGVFALLLLLERQGEIIHFIKDEVCDGALPVVSYQDMCGLCLRRAPDKPLECFKSWKAHEMEYFIDRQYHISVPFFAPEHGSGSNEMIAPHYTFDDGTLLPWCARDTNAPSSAHSTGLSERSGGFATVLRVRMDPRCHGFQEILDKIYLSQEYFALKVLHQAQWNDQEKFQREVEQLKRFNGLVHAHLVTLLATFTFKKRYHFLFPYAECDLDLYWETKVPNPSPEDLNTVLWFSDQIRGIMEAISIIHNPPHIQERFGRHGDLKPDNILWYKRANHPNGIFVVSDMGLSALNREGTRSNIPNKNIPPTPGYRPPECDIENGTISRAYDIWTLGCLFMEMVVWFLGGNIWLQEFSNERRTVVYLTGSVSNIFFDIRTIEQENTGAQEAIEYVVQVKTEVAKWFQKIRSHELCTQFILEIIEIIELEMLVVLSADKTRSSAAKLKGTFNDIHKNCETADYCMKRVPVPSIVRVATAVKANLNENARKMISENRPRLSTHEGTAPHKSMPSDEMKKMN